MATRGLRGAVEAWLLALWFDPPAAAPPVRWLRGLARALLRPLSWVVAAVATRRRARIDRRSDRSRPAVVVIGNLVVGGAGKTPVVIALVEALRARGFTPGVLARGYGGSGGAARLVGRREAADAGDEPVLIARTAACPVAVGADRAAALAVLREQAPQVDVAVSDDGLQHAALPRDLEVAVFDARGAGNGAVLPAGPLREPLSALASIDAVLLNGTDRAPVPHPRVFRSRVAAAGFRPVARDRAALDAPGGLVLPAAFAARTRGLRVVAVAGLGAPRRFFSMLQATGIDCAHTLALPDHAALTPAMLAGLRADLVLMTEKDAVKCERHADARCWALAIRAELDAAFVEFVARRLRDR